MKIGIHIEPQMGYTFQEIVNLAKTAESLNFHQFTVSDHFFGSPELPATNSYEAWTLLALLTPTTKKIRLGTQVTCQSYRNPALLAKIVSNIDNASNGRIDFGIGAGWKKTEYKAYGYNFPATKLRIQQLNEALEIIRLLWTENEPPSFIGEFYQIEETKFLPKPIQKPHIPIWIGTQTLKAPKMEKIIAKYADVIIYESCTIDIIQEKQERMKKACKSEGRDYKSLKWCVNATPFIWKDNNQFQEFKSHLKSMYPELNDKNLEPYKNKWLNGSIDKVLSEIKQYQNNSIDQLTVCLPILPSFNDLEKWGLDTMEILSKNLIR